MKIISLDIEDLSNDSTISPVRELFYRLRNRGVGDGWSEAMIVGEPGEKSTYFQIDGNVVKDNKSTQRAQLEHHIYTELKRRGFPVVSDLRAEGTKIIMPYVRGIPLDIALIHAFNKLHLSDMFGDKEESIADVKEKQKFYGQALELMTQVNSILGDILTEEQKAWLLDQNYSKLTDRFNISRDEVEQNYSTYRLMNALNIDDQEFVRTFSPIQALMNEKNQKYAIWNMGFRPNNFFITMDGDLVMLDFNNPHYSAMQIDDSFMLDAYLPYKGMSEVNVTINGVVMDSVNLPQNIPNQLAVKVAQWNALNPERKLDQVDYRHAYSLFAVERNLMSMVGSFKEFLKTLDEYNDETKLIEERPGPGHLYNLCRAVIHHWNRTCLYLTAMDQAGYCKTDFLDYLKPIVEEKMLRTVEHYHDQLVEKMAAT